jgi:hypothetical protein
MLTTISLRLPEADCASNRKAAGALHSEAAGRSRLSALAAVVFNVASSRCRLRAAAFDVLRFDLLRKEKPPE